MIIVNQGTRLDVLAMLDYNNFFLCSFILHFIYWVFHVRETMWNLCLCVWIILFELHDLKLHLFLYNDSNLSTLMADWYSFMYIITLSSSIHLLMDTDYQDLANMSCAVANMGIDIV